MIHQLKVTNVKFISNEYATLCAMRIDENRDSMNVDTFIGQQ